MHQMWRLSDAGPHNLGLACTDDGLLLGQTLLIERRDGRFVVRARDDVERLLKCAYGGELPLERLMSGFERVAAALNANDQCGARIAAVHMQMPDLASAAVRDALAAEDSLIKYARDGSIAANWNPALHPRAGTPPNPGWFATTGGASNDSPNVRVAENNDPSRRSDRSSHIVDDWVHPPPAKRNDELGDFLEWLANAKPEDEQTIRAEINRYWVGDVHALGTLNFMLSQVLKPGTTRQDRQQILELIDNYSRYDPAEASHLYDQLFDLLALLGVGLPARPPTRIPGTREAAPAEAKSPSKSPPPAAAGQLLAEADAAAWKLPPTVRGRYMEMRLGRTLHENFPVIDKIPNGIATSIKSIDLPAATYQNMGIFVNRLSKYVGEVSEFVGGRLGEDVVEFSHIKGRALEVAVPKGTMTPQQQEIVEAVRSWAKTLRNPVELTIIEK